MCTKHVNQRCICLVHDETTNQWRLIPDFTTIRPFLLSLAYDIYLVISYQ